MTKGLFCHLKIWVIIYENNRLQSVFFFLDSIPRIYDFNVDML